MACLTGSALVSAAGADCIVKRMATGKVEEHMNG